MHEYDKNFNNGKSNVAAQDLLPDQMDHSQNNQYRYFEESIN